MFIQKGHRAQWKLLNRSIIIIIAVRLYTPPNRRPSASMQRSKGRDRGGGGEVCARHKAADGAAVISMPADGGWFGGDEKMWPLPIVVQCARGQRGPFSRK